MRIIATSDPFFFRVPAFHYVRDGWLKQVDHDPQAVAEVSDGSAVKSGISWPRPLENGVSIGRGMAIFLIGKGHSAAYKYTFNMKVLNVKTMIVVPDLPSSALTIPTSNKEATNMLVNFESTQPLLSISIRVEDVYADSTCGFHWQ